ncbi:MAG TPA: hypothetical protein VK184_06230 [Nostocaceae cyanobacterium]|nr:hypothetical protein [Nostocaceae cyanobacterium]
MYPIFISTSLSATSSPASWESSAVGVEYLFMGEDGQHQRQNTEDNYDFAYLGFDMLNIKPQINVISGRYELKNAVPE